MMCHLNPKRLGVPGKEEKSISARIVIRRGTAARVPVVAVKGNATVAVKVYLGCIAASNTRRRCIILHTLRDHGLKVLKKQHEPAMRALRVQQLSHTDDGAMRLQG
jgi:hypothetical protein